MATLLSNSCTHSLQARRLIDSRQLPAVTRAAETQQAESTDDVQIEGIDRSYCDEFECTSSPAVERNLKALARDITRVSRWTLSFFASKVEYQDAFRKFQGREKYMRNNFPAQALQDSKVLVTKLRMLERDTGTVSWRLRAKIGFIPLDVDFESKFKLDLITGSVLRQNESWSLHRMSVPAKVVFLAARLGWSAGQLSQDLAEKAKEGRQDDNSQQQDIYRDPTDPTKFFQQEDDTMRDALQIATILALLWLVANAWWQLEHIK